MKAWLAIVCGCTAVLTLGFTVESRAGAGQQIDINFDQDPFGNDLPNGTDLADEYVTWGVTFAAAGSGSNPCGTSAYASSECVTNGTTSPPNVVTLCSLPTCSDISENAHGLVRASLAAPASEVCIEFQPVDNQQGVGVIRAYNSANVLIGQATTTLGGGIQNLCVNAPGIRAVEFSGLGSTFGWFDNLQVFFDVVPTVPVTFGAIKAMYR